MRLGVVLSAAARSILARLLLSAAAAACDRLRTDMVFEDENYTLPTQNPPTNDAVCNDLNCRNLRFRTSSPFPPHASLWLCRSRVGATAVRSSVRSAHRHRHREP